MCGAMLSGLYVRRAESEALALSEPRMYRLKNDGRRSLSKFAQLHKGSKSVSMCPTAKITFPPLPDASVG